MADKKLEELAAAQLEDAQAKIKELEKALAEAPKPAKAGVVEVKWPTGKDSHPATPAHSLHAAKLQREAAAKK